MTATPPEGGGFEPVDFSELTATDALLDRLGARDASTDDLLDPTASLLAELLAVVDEAREPDVGLARLVEVLDGRPLYVAGAEEAEGWVGEIGFDLNFRPADPDTKPADAELADPELADAESGDAESGDIAADAPRVIDLTEHVSTDEVAASADDEAEVAASADGPAATVPEAAGIAARVASEPEPEVSPPTAEKSEPVAPTPELGVVIPIQGRRRHWERALSQVSLPAAAAAVVLLLALGGGVSAAVTGDPMAPVNGVTRVVAQIPGVGNPSGSLSEVRGEITAARRAVQQNNEPSANQHLQAARRGLSDVPDGQKPELQSQIASVETQLAGTPIPGGPLATPPPGAAATTAPADPVPPTGAAATTAPADPDPTVAPSSDPEPTSVPTTTAPVQGQATQDPAPPTPDATETGS